ncbi:MAG: hypothetical protein KKB30_08890 [Proteobacteria bacterium]|nr:hypothetical protein [Pseudomonadota bacterium]MBU1716861.1 hypothetical protein [Pseudomonadota bacterium]
MNLGTDQHKPKVLSKGSQRIICPTCGNDSDFLEIADGVLITSNYIQNSDGSFTLDGDDSQVLGEIKFFCGECNADLSRFHQHFMEMLF